MRERGRGRERAGRETWRVREGGEDERGWEGEMGSGGDMGREEKCGKMRAGRGRQREGVREVVIGEKRTEKVDSRSYLLSQSWLPNVGKLFDKLADKGPRPHHCVIYLPACTCQAMRTVELCCFLRIESC
mgnify:CR=1 FL=1